MKKIVITSTSFIERDQRILKISQTLALNGYSVLILSRGIFDESHSPNLWFKTVTTIFNSGPLFYIEYNIRLFFLLLLNRYEIVCAVDVDTILACCYASFLKQKTMVFDAHEYYVETPELTNRKVVKLLWQWVEKISMWRCTFGYSVNDELAHIFSKRYGVAFSTITNAPYYKEVIDINKQRYFTLIYQGVINEGRGIEIYIKAMESLTNCQLWLLGTGDLDDKIKNQIEASPAKDRIGFYGQKSPKELNEFTKAAHLGLNMLDARSLSYKLSLANKFFDYTMAEIPAVHMRFPVYERYIKKHEVGLLIEEFNVSSLVNAVKQLITNPALYDAMVKNCITAKREWCWEKESNRLINMYKSL